MASRLNSTLRAALLSCVFGCAVPGPPRPAAPSPTPCPRVHLVDWSEAGLELALRVPPPPEGERWSGLLMLYRALGPGAPLEVYRELDLEELGAEVIAVEGGELAFIEAAPHPREPRFALAMLGSASIACAPQRVALAVSLPELEPGPPPAPEVEVVGELARVRAPGPGPWRLSRRDLRQRDAPPVIVAERWSGETPWVDTGVEAGKIYAYRLERAYVARTEPAASSAVARLGPPGPEAYAAITPLEERFGPP